MNNRRKIIKSICLTPLVNLPSALAVSPDAMSGKSGLGALTDPILRKIPSSLEPVPAIGMGSYQTFNITDNPQRLANMRQVLQIFHEAGGSLIDSSPMYGASEAVIGELLSDLTITDTIFAASKVWTYGEAAGLEAIKTSARRMQVKTMDLMQVHNLRDWQVQLKNLQKLKAQGKIRYTGITTSRLAQYDEFEQVMRSQKLDFIQLNYNIKIREAEKRLLPLAQDRGMAVVVNMPFEKGRLFNLVKNHQLPEFAKEIDCQSWGQFFLKFILSHPAVTCAIPATSNVRHVKDNMQAMYGRLPDKAMRKKMLNFFEGL